MSRGDVSAFPKLGVPGYGDSFPVPGPGGQETLWVEHAGGLTKRELFAAMAMQGLLARIGAGEGTIRSGIANEAVKMADCLLEALERRAP